MQVKIVGFVIFLCFHFCLQGQEVRRACYKWPVDTIFAENKTWIVHDLKTKEGVQIEKKYYQKNGNKLVFDSSSFKLFSTDSICLEFRLFPINFEKQYATFDRNKRNIDTNIVLTPYEFEPYKVEKNINTITGTDLNYNGSFSRGIAVGNTQNLLLNSRFDLQLEGDIGDGIKIKGAISDDNIPIQAQGNTQNLQEFDKVFIEVSKDSSSLIAGDFTLTRPRSYFQNYLKKLKGIGITSTNIVSKNWTNISKATIANSRGKFARYTLQISEGNQGPYRLNGINNERFIIVLSGTERIYSNGNLLKRGFDYDYVIDYNSATISFTANHLIGREDRIIVEFEYTDLRYSRSLYTLHTAFEHQKSTWYVDFYREQDSKSPTATNELDTTSLRILAESGDNKAKAIRSGIKPKTSTSETSYALISNPNFPIDTVAKILMFTTNPDSAAYTANFTEVGQGMGSYDIDVLNATNGRVYRYVGQNKGKYVPQISLIPPEQKQQFSIGGKYQLTNQLTMAGELTISGLDKNRLSIIDDSDNNGTAAYLKLTHQTPSFTKGKGWQNSLHWEHLQQQFTNLNPYRPTEFYRDWSLQINELHGEELLMNATSKWAINSQNRISLVADRYQVSNQFEGMRFGGQFEHVFKKISLLFKPSITQSKKDTIDNQFIKAYVQVARPIWGERLHWMSSLEAEDNAFNSQTKQLSNSYAFQLWKHQLSIHFTKTSNLSLQYNQRQESYSNLESLKPVFKIREYGAKFATNWGSNSLLDIDIKARSFDVLDATLGKNEKSKRTLIGQINNNFSLLRQSIRSISNYQINAGQEPKIEFVFQKVTNYQGDYIYIGNEEDAVKNINDFRYDPSNPLANYIKVTLPNSEFIKTNNLQAAQSFHFDPSKLWAQDTTKLNRWKQWISRFSALANWQWQNKLLSTANTTSYEFSNFTFSDSLTVSYLRNTQWSLFFNRGGDQYDVAYHHRVNDVGLNQINGREFRTLTEDNIQSRVNVWTSLDLIYNVTFGKRSFDNALFKERDYIIAYTKHKPELNKRFGTKYRLGGYVEWIHKKQQINDLEQMSSTNYNVYANIRTKKIGSIDISFSVVNIVYTGELKSFISYDLLDGLKPGKNLLTSLRLIRRIGGGLDLILSYEGRKLPNVKTIHQASVQLKASF